MSPIERIRCGALFRSPAPPATPSGVVPKLLRARDASAYLGVAERTLRHLVWCGLLRVVRLDRRFVRFELAELDATIARARVEGAS